MHCSITCLPDPDDKVTAEQAKEHILDTLSYVDMGDFTLTVIYVTDEAQVLAHVSVLISPIHAQNLHCAMKNVLRDRAPAEIHDGTRCIPCDIAA